MCPWNHDKGFKKGRGSLDKYRVCYEDGTVCQMQCWPRHKADGNSNKEMKLYGLDKLLGHYKIEPTELVTNSYETWKKWHNFDIPNKFDPVVGSLKRNESALRLPVCFSQHNVLVDLDKKESRNFPFICGFFGSETRAVLDKINMKRSSVNGEMLQGKAADVFQNYIIPRMRYWSAVKRFVALCELDIHWPYKQHHKMVMTKGADKRCGEVKEAIEGLTELEANQWFCNEWKGRRQLKKDESMWIESKIPFPINHHRRCIDFRDNYKKKGAKLFPDQTKINMQANYTDQFLAEQHHNEALHESPSSESESVDVRDFAGAPSFPEAPSAPSDWPGQIMYGSSSGSPWNLTKASRLKYFPKSHKDETSGYH
ncbi:hypothetical protein PVAG01_04472 [Phlyctema vagabunda]|uniref:Uncharacterized protein n=1 Tax=Phlyctema vagabunda TaxID=108571 RepID=A0ABR4PPB2_9HELO